MIESKYKVSRNYEIHCGIQPKKEEDKAQPSSKCDMDTMKEDLVKQSSTIEVQKCHLLNSEQLLVKPAFNGWS